MVQKMELILSKLGSDIYVSDKHLHVFIDCQNGIRFYVLVVLDNEKWSVSCQAEFKGLTTEAISACYIKEPIEILEALDRSVLVKDHVAIDFQELIQEFRKAC